MAVVLIVVAIAVGPLFPLRVTVCDAPDGVECDTICSSLVGITIPCGVAGSLVAVGVGVLAAVPVGVWFERRKGMPASA